MCVLGQMCMLIMRPVIIYCRFLLISPLKSLGLKFETQKRPVSPGSLKVSFWST
jgi:hypothetical protein